MVRQFSHSNAFRRVFVRIDGKKSVPVALPVGLEGGESNVVVDIATEMVVADEFASHAECAAQLLVLSKRHAADVVCAFRDKRPHHADRRVLSVHAKWV